MSTIKLWARRAWVAAWVAALVGGPVYLYLTYLTPRKLTARIHLDRADIKAEAAIEGRLSPVRDLFAAGRKGAPGFAGEVLGFNGKWRMVRGVVAGDYKEFVADAFARHVFSPGDLRAAIEASCGGYAGDLEVVEAEMLVALRADLADLGGAEPRPPAPAPAAVGREAEALAGRVADVGRVDLGVTAGREVFSGVVAEMAAAAAVQAARAAAVEMGVSGGVLTGGAASFAATLGVGAVVALIIDYVLDALFKAVGYDPEAQVAAAVVASLDKMEAALVRDAGVRRHVGLGEHGALRAELGKMHAARSGRRWGVVQQVLKEGGGR